MGRLICLEAESLKCSRCNKRVFHLGSWPNGKPRLLNTDPIGIVIERWSGNSAEEGGEGFTYESVLGYELHSCQS